MSKETDISVSRTFQCKLEQHERKAFQAAGHWVAGSTEDDKLHPRPRMGEWVYVLTLYHSQAPDKQVLRVQAGTEAEAAEAMGQAIADHLMSLQRAEWIRAEELAAYSEMCRERGRLAEFLAANYGEEVNPDDEELRTVVDVAIRHLRAERERWTVRFGGWLLRLIGKPRRVGWTAPAGAKGQDGNGRN